MGDTGMNARLGGWGNMHPGARLSAAPSPHLHCVASIGSRPGSAQPMPSLSLISLRLSGEFSLPLPGGLGGGFEGKAG